MTTPPRADSTKVPEGWKLVPVAPTTAMLDAGCHQMINSAREEEILSGYAAMLAAAPSPTAPAQEVVTEVSRLMRWIDGYAFDYAAEGKLSTSRLLVEKELFAALAGQARGGEAAGWRLKIGGKWVWYEDDPSDIATSKMLETLQRLVVAPIPAAPAQTRYWTQPAESLIGIALRQLKDESRWTEIRDLNADSFPDMGPYDYYPVGTAITMPAPAPQGTKGGGND